VQGRPPSAAWVAELARFGGFLAAYYVAYRFGMSFGDASSSPFWFPDSVLLCALLAARPSRWWLYLAAALAIRLSSEVSAGVPAWFLLTTFSLDAAKGVVAAVALRRLLNDPLRWRTVRDYAVFCAVAVVLVPAVSAFGGAAARAARGYDYWLAWEQWFLGDAIAQLVITPILLYWLVRPPRFRALSIARVGEGALLLVALAVSGYWAVHAAGEGMGAISRLYAPLPFLFWAAIRFGVRGASGALAVTTVLAVNAALSGERSFVGGSPEATALGLQQFLLLCAVPLSLVAILIEQRTATEEALRESGQRFRELADAAPVLMWTSDANGRADFFNRSWLAFTGTDVDAALGDGWRSLIHPDDKARYDELRQRAGAVATPLFDIEYRVRRADGKWRWILESTAVRREAGRTVGHVSTAVDITERKEAEDLGRKIEHVQRLATLGELTALIAHEVRQPLTATLLNLEAAERALAERNALDEELAQILSDLRHDALRAGDAIRRIRELLQRRHDEAVLIEINEIVADVVQLIAGDALRRRVEVFTVLGSALPQVRGNTAELQHVLLNLISNAMDAVEHEDGARSITIRTRPVADGVEVSVTDTGRGIPADALPKLFESFYTTRANGLGLGLTIARTIVTAHHGQISAENDPAGGATFRFMLPATASVPE